jgi:hypothetical protein
MPWLLVINYQSKYKTNDHEQIGNKSVLQITESLTLCPLFYILREQEISENGSVSVSGGLTEGVNYDHC